MDKATFYTDVKKFWENRNKQKNLCWEDFKGLNELLVLKYLKRGNSILDLGCGEGDLLKKVSSIIQFGEGVDWLPSYKQTIDNVRFTCIDLKEFNPERKYDIITMFGITQYMQEDDLVKLYKKLKTSLKDGGKLLIKHQVSTCELDKEVASFSEKLNANYYSIFRTLKSDMKLLREGGFEIYDIIDPYPANFNKWPDTQYKMYICVKNPRVELRSNFVSCKEELDLLNAQWFKVYTSIREKKTLDKEENKKLLLFLREHMTKYRVVPIVSFGTLLGMVRDCDLISWDTDIDIIIRESEAEYLVDVIKNLPKEYRLLRIERNGMYGDICVSIGNDKCFADIYIYIDINDKEYSYTWHSPEKFNIRKEDLDVIDTIDFLDKKFVTLRNKEQYLTKWYGDWRKPQKYHQERF